MTQVPLYRSIYAYAFDIADIGTTRFIDHAIELGLSDITLATSYHAGKFLRPRARTNVVTFPQDGVVYFEPRAQAYGELVPQMHSEPALCRVGRDLIDDARLRVHAWTVLLHNSRLGALFPQYVARNAFGDGYVYSLCPMHNAVFDYAVALCRDQAEQHALASLVLETPGWLPYAHGYHHEFAQTRSNVWLDAMLGLCFCPACIERARICGIDAAALGRRIAQRVRDYLGSPVDAAPDQASAWLSADLVADAQLLAFLHMRQQRVTELVAAIRDSVPRRTDIAVIPTVQRPTAASIWDGSDLLELARVADWLELPLYEPDAQRIAADLWHTAAAMGVDRVRAILRPGPPDLTDDAALAAALRALQQAGVGQLAFYNYGLLREDRLAALAGALAQWPQQP